MGYAALVLTIMVLPAIPQRLGVQDLFNFYRTICHRHGVLYMYGTPMWDGYGMDVGLMVGM